MYQFCWIANQLIKLFIQRLSIQLSLTSNELVDKAITNYISDSISLFYNSPQTAPLNGSLNDSLKRLLQTAPPNGSRQTALPNGLPNFATEKFFVFAIALRLLKEGAVWGEPFGGEPFRGSRLGGAVWGSRLGGAV